MINSENKKNFVILLLMFLLQVFSLTGCLDIEKINIYLTLDKDDLYAGRAAIEFINIHSNAETAEEQKKDLSDIFTDYNKEAEKIIRVMPLFNNTVQLRNRKELSTDVVIHGEFKNVLAVLGAFISENNFRIEGNKKRLSACWGNPFTDSTETNLIIVYPGRIVSHNSKDFDPKNGTMKWNMSKSGDREVRFVLESE